MNNIEKNKFLKERLNLEHTKDPIFLEREMSGHKLYWLGTEHSWNPKHKQFDQIKKKWEEFLKKVDNPLAVIEGAYRPNSFKTPKEAIRNRGESGFVTFLGETNNVEVTCFEPSYEDQIKTLLDKFDFDKVFCYRTAAIIDQWNNINDPNLKIEDYLGSYIEYVKKYFGKRGEVLSVEYLESIYPRVFGKEIDYRDQAWFNDLGNPFNEDNIFLEIAQAMSRHRDDYIVNRLKEEIKNHDVFMVYGRGHYQPLLDRLDEKA